MVVGSSNFAQNSTSNSGIISGKVIDSKTKKPLDYVSLTLKLKGVNVATTLSDDDGLYTFKNLQTNQDYDLDLMLICFTYKLVYPI